MKKEEEKYKKQIEKKDKNLIFHECDFPDEYREVSIVCGLQTVILRSTYAHEDINFLVKVALKILEKTEGK